jgi:DNA-directed RNA polymerase specialized sigma24 family protein
VFCLHCLEGWSYQDVAGQLGVTVNAVGVLLHRARQRLRAWLADSLNVPEGPR